MAQQHALERFHGDTLVWVADEKRGLHRVKISELQTPCLILTYSHQFSGLVARPCSKVTKVNVPTAVVNVALRDVREQLVVAADQKILASKGDIMEWRIAKDLLFEGGMRAFSLGGFNTDKTKQEITRLYEKLSNSDKTKLRRPLDYQIADKFCQKPSQDKLVRDILSITPGGISSDMWTVEVMGTHYFFANTILVQDSCVLVPQS